MTRVYWSLTQFSIFFLSHCHVHKCRLKDIQFTQGFFFFSLFYFLDSISSFCLLAFIFYLTFPYNCLISPQDEGASCECQVFFTLSFTFFSFYHHQTCPLSRSHTHFFLPGFSTQQIWGFAFLKHVKVKPVPAISPFTTSNGASVNEDCRSWSDDAITWESSIVALFWFSTNEPSLLINLFSLHFISPQSFSLPLSHTSLFIIFYIFTEIFLKLG